ncbi:MAG: hypothetical protein QOE61_5674 [Micromonosporaceae bacterium]|jgi:hypothetical protein|nr:hypothetical protein [Micromonosporaceae bacterium]
MVSTDLEVGARRAARAAPVADHVSLPRCDTARHRLPVQLTLPAVLHPRLSRGAAPDRLPISGGGLAAGVAALLPARRLMDHHVCWVTFERASASHGAHRREMGPHVELQGSGVWSGPRSARSRPAAARTAPTRHCSTRGRRRPWRRGYRGSIVDRPSCLQRPLMPSHVARGARCEGSHVHVGLPSGREGFGLVEVQQVIVVWRVVPWPGSPSVACLGVGLCLVHPVAPVRVAVLGAVVRESAERRVDGPAGVRRRLRVGVGLRGAEVQNRAYLRRCCRGSRMVLAGIRILDMGCESGL